MCVVCVCVFVSVCIVLLKQFCKIIFLDLLHAHVCFASHIFYDMRQYNTCVVLYMCMFIDTNSYRVSACMHVHLYCVSRSESGRVCQTLPCVCASGCVSGDVTLRVCHHHKL